MNQQNTGLFSAQDTAAQSHTANAVRGAANLVDNCIGAVEGKHVLLVCEDSVFGWYDAEAPDLVQQQLLARGAIVTRMTVGLPTNRIDLDVQDAMTTADTVVFFARLGDQGRFKPRYSAPHSVMSYALNAGMLGSGYGMLDHQIMCSFKDAIDRITLTAERITVTCPRGTRFEGSPGDSLRHGKEVVVRRFPMGIPQPVLNDGFSGEVVLAHYLTPTGSKIYTPDTLKLRAPVTVRFEGNQIIGFSGPADVVAEVESHYQRIADTFGLDTWHVDSWHAGIHPLMAYDAPVARDPVRWSSTAFQHPRLLHFHTCGNVPPGEICWTVIDPTILIDGVALWQDGRLHPERFAATKEILDMAPDLAAAFHNQNRWIGLDPELAM